MNKAARRFGFLGVIGVIGVLSFLVLDVKTPCACYTIEETLRFEHGFPAAVPLTEDTLGRFLEDKLRGREAIALGDLPVRRRCNQPSPRVLLCRYILESGPLGQSGLLVEITLTESGALGTVKAKQFRKGIFDGSA
jgi:hypothetical protein